MLSIKPQNFVYKNFATDYHDAMTRIIHEKLPYCSFIDENGLYDI